MRSFFGQKGSTSIKMGEKLLPQGVCTVFGSKEALVEELWRNRDETKKNREESWNPKCESTVRSSKVLLVPMSSGGRRRSLDQLRLMQRPRLRKTRGAAAVAELGFWGVERRKAMEREE